MKKNYLVLYYLSSILTFGVIIFALVSQLCITQVVGQAYAFNEFFKDYAFVDALIIVSFFLFVFNVMLRSKKYEFKVNNDYMVLLYLVFFMIMTVIALIFNRYEIIRNIHFEYFYGFIIFDYLLLSLYTFLSFDLKKGKN